MFARLDGYAAQLLQWLQQQALEQWLQGLQWWGAQQQAQEQLQWGATQAPLGFCGPRGRELLGRARLYRAFNFKCVFGSPSYAASGG